MAIDKDLAGVGLLDYLGCDPRPTFVLDTVEASPDNSVAPVYYNPALAAVDSGRLLDAIRGKTSVHRSAEHGLESTTSEFRGWIAQAWSSTTQSHHGKQFPSGGFDWTKVLVERRWCVISGSPSKGAIDASPSSHAVGFGPPAPAKPSSRGRGPRSGRHVGESLSSFDWTNERTPKKISPHIEFARSVDWSQTQLGPMSAWSTQLRSTANLVMQDPRPAVVFWGPDVVMIYNDSYVELLGELHPACMGTSARVGLRDVWHQFEPIIVRNLAGETVEETETPVFLVRSGFLEETYFSLKFLPVWDNEGATVGHYETVTEITREHLLQRRLSILLQLSEETPRARDVKSYSDLAIEVLSHNDKDVPFALLYSVETKGPAEETRPSPTNPDDVHGSCMLRGSLGVTSESPAAATRLYFKDNHGFMPWIRQSMCSRLPVVVELEEGSPAANLTRGIQWRGFGDPCRAAAIYPIVQATSEDDILGFLVIGLNPRRPYDEDYRQFLQLASRLLSASLTSILLHEEDIKRREQAIARAETMKTQLTEQLLTTQKEVVRNNLKFQRFAEGADIGIFIIGLDGVFSYRNEAWYGIFQPTDREVELGQAWDQLIDDEYAAVGKAKFDLLMKEKQHQSFELRLKRVWDARSWKSELSSFDKQPMWVLCSVFPELSEDGEVLEIVGCVTDISRQKWGEKMQAARACDAQESKKQLENFIDITSHEMRNPLSAIVQCADGIISAHKTRSSTDRDSITDALVHTCIEAAETIVQCSQHMKCIVDDILTMSKLDSGLLVMTPVDVQPAVIARHAVKMFEGEAKAAKVGLKFSLESSCHQIGVDWVSLDPTRLLQILINLITNAIKFTRLETTRDVSISMGLSNARPLRGVHGIPYIRMLDAIESPSLQADWEKGETVYIQFTVQDTGRGLTNAEKELLFARFSQASPRTHINYGGSGLGLFISRRLTEMHGGAIGFDSNTGSGSTFSFYVKCRKSKHFAQAVVPNGSTTQSLYAQTVFLSSHPTDEPVKVANTRTNAKEIDGKNRQNILHVLVVEDNLVNQRVLAKQLRALGMEVAVANHGGEALDYLRSTKFCAAPGAAGKDLSLILMDWEMPVMDGLSCVRNIRQMQRDGIIKGYVPVIAVTANVRSEQVKVAIDAGMDDVVSKPFRVPELCGRIRKLMANLGI